MEYDHHAFLRDHTFVINGVIAETLATKGAATELIICDYSKCFDVQDVDITTNDMFECGVVTDQLNLMYKCDAYSKVAVKTPVGLTSRVDLLKFIPQGSTMAGHGAPDTSSHPTDNARNAVQCNTNAMTCSATQDAEMQHDGNTTATK